MKKGTRHSDTPADAAKTCTGPCARTLPLSAFHGRHRSPDGRAARCKACRNADLSHYRRANGEKINARARARRARCRDADRRRCRKWRGANTKKSRAATRNYRRTHRAARRAYRARYKRENPVTLAAQLLVQAAILLGRLTRDPCEICGRVSSRNFKIHGHHEDYSRPLKVRWLCAAHHNQVHAGTVALPPRARGP